MPSIWVRSGTGHAEQLFPQVKLWIAFLLFIEPSLSRLFRQSGPLGPILESREVLFQLLITLRDMLLAKTRIPPVPAARQTADPLASYLKACAISSSLASTR